MRFKYIMLSLVLIASVGAKAQEVDASEKPKRLHFGVNFGTGHATPYSFMGERISDNGYATITALEAVHFDVGYVINKRYSIISGFGGQNLSLRYVYDDEAYRYNGGRVLIPLGFRMHLGPSESPAKIIMGLGGYYTFDAENALLT
ncbi:MAG: hypothetical protein LAT54_09535, partial [Cryomorphaceae bacterium]|nr:hypothetical protein [Cryomorphaceae bacterium]